MSIGIPVKLLHEAEGHIVTCFFVTLELKNGDIYRGHLTTAEDSMNCHLQNITLTARNGHSFIFIHNFNRYAYIRGSSLRFVIVPDMLKNAPIFKRMVARQKRGTGSVKVKKGAKKRKTKT